MLLGSGWKAFKARVSGAPPDEAYALVTARGFRTGLSSGLDGLVAGPDDALGLAIAGGLLVFMAQRARGWRDAEKTSRRRWQRHFELLEHAADALTRSLRLDETSGLAAGFLARAAIHQDGEDVDVAEAALERARRPPAAAFVNLMVARTPKWGGSEHAMWKTARRWAAAALPGSQAVIARAHYEQWLQFAAFDEAPGARQRAAAYWKSPEVMDDLITASDLALKATLPYGDRFNAHLADGWLGRVLVDARQPTRAARHLRRLGGYADPEVWTIGMRFKPKTSLRLYRRSAGLLF